MKAKIGSVYRRIRAHGSFEIDQRAIAYISPKPDSKAIDCGHNLENLLNRNDIDPAPNSCCTGVAVVAKLFALFSLKNLVFT